MLIDG